MFSDQLRQENLSDSEYMAEAIFEYAREYGEQQPDRAWILTPFDTWVSNPSYSGPEVPHPESQGE